MTRKDKIVKEAQGIHKMFFGRGAKKVTMTKYAGKERALILLGEVIQLRYRAKKHEDKKPQFYEHEFERQPEMYFDPVNGAIILMPIRIEKEGISG